MKLITYLFFFLWLAACSTGKQESPQKPDIVILFVDDLGYNDLGFRRLGFYTPNIDKLARESVNMENAYVPSATCSPSRVGLYTGQHPSRLGFYRHVPHNVGDAEYNVLNNDSSLLLSRNWLPLEVTTYAEVLKNHDYNTFFLGKWHIGDEQLGFGPLQQGFDKAITKSDAGAPQSYYSPYFPGKGWWDSIPDNQYLTDYLTDRAVEYIRNYDSDKPFLLQYSYYNVHTPNVGRKDFHETYRERGLEGPLYTQVSAADEYLYAAGFPQHSQLIEYGSQVSAVDESVGRIMAALKESGRLENTLVIFTSDQGSYFPNTPLRGTKKDMTSLYEGGQKVPFFVQWPAAFKGGRTLGTHIQTTDVFSTLCEIVGEDPASYEGLEGLSLLRLLRDGEPINRKAMISLKSYSPQYASVLRDDNWKIVAYMDGRYELFKVDEDISEENDLAAKHPEKVNELAKILKNWEKEMGISF